jgi:hypothetical protein
MKKHKKKNRSISCGYRAIRTRQEIAANQEIKDEHGREKFGRARRNKKSLDSWTNEKQHNVQNNWKKRSKERKQYSFYGRGQKHIYILKIDSDCLYSRKEWNFKNYCNKNMIPHNIRKFYIRRTTKTGYKYKTLTKIQLMWWSNEDIGIEYVLSKNTY